MPTLHVCSLARLHDTVAQTRASHVVTLINTGFLVERPLSIQADRHLFLNISDIVEPLEGHILPAEDHIRTLLTFVRNWDRTNPLVFHCWAGVSRSTAAAYVSACMLAPDRNEADIAEALRRASPTATPNAKFVALADEMLGRRGRMVAAVEAIGRGAECMEGTPFMLKIDRD
jgi:predicted protein tyrosine phosphatase